MTDLEPVPSRTDFAAARRRKSNKGIKESARGSQDSYKASKEKMMDVKKRGKKTKRESMEDMMFGQDYEYGRSHRRSTQSDIHRGSRFSNESQRKAYGNDEDEDIWKNSELSSPKISHSVEYVGEEEEDDADSSPLLHNADKPKEDEPRPRSGKPQTWIRLRPCPRVQDNLFDVTNDGKGIVMHPNYGANGNRKTYRDEREEQGFSFFCDGVLRNSSQEDTYQTIAHELVGKAMEGISGLIVSVGPEVSGKNFTLFGSTSKFQYRGIIPRSLERIFQICAAKVSEMRYLIRMAIVEIRNDKIRDLLTLGSYEGNSFDSDATNGMIFQKIGAAEHGFGLLIRALTCQKEIHREPYAKPHTVVFIDIYGESYTNGPPEANPRIVKSRITFAKTAPIPERDVLFPPPLAEFQSPCQGQNHNQTQEQEDGCLRVPVPPSKPDWATQLKNRYCNYNGSTCNRMSCTKKKLGPVAEAIRIRQDIGFLEQMCSRACQYQRFAHYYEKVNKEYNGYAFAGYMPPPRSQLFRLSKLTYCLKDIVSGNTEIRILLHIRPERKYKHASLETMRFAEKAKCVPYGISNDFGMDDADKAASSGVIYNFTRPGQDVNLKDFLSKLPPEISDLYIQVLPGTFRHLRDHGGALFDGKTHAIEEIGESQVQCLFDKFKSLWNFVMETGVLPSTAAVSAHTVESSESLDVRKEHSHSITDKPTSAKRLKSGGKLSKASLKKGKEEKKGKKNKISKTKTSAGEEEQGSQISAKIESIPDASVASVDEKPPLELPDVSLTPSQLAIVRENEDESEKNLETEVTRTRSVVEDAPVPELETSILPAVNLDTAKEAPTKEDAWTEFLSTEKGLEMGKSLKDKTELLRTIAAEHHEQIKLASSFLNRLNDHQSDLKVAQQERFMMGDEYDAEENVVISSREKQIIQEIKQLETGRNQAAYKMKDARERLQILKREIEASKLDVELAFQFFTLENYATLYEGSGQLEKPAESALSADQRSASMTNELRMKDDQERIRKFEDIKRVAKKQARYFLKALAKQPSWVPY